MRKSVEITIAEDGAPVVFRIQQWAATEKESWILRAVLALAGSAGSNIDLDLSGGVGADALMRELGKRGLGIFAGLKYETVKPLLDDLLSCCYHKVGAAEIRCTSQNIDGVISDVKSLFKLRTEAFKVNFPDFFMPKEGTAAETESRSDSDQSQEVTRIKLPR